MVKYLVFSEPIQHLDRLHPNPLKELSGRMIRGLCLGYDGCELHHSSGIFDYRIYRFTGVTLSPKLRQKLIRHLLILVIVMLPDTDHSNE